MKREEETRDISSAGVSFLSPAALEPGSRIEYVITLAGSQPPVRIRCNGKVLRSQKTGASAKNPFEIAVSMERYKFIRTPEKEEGS